MGLFTKGAKPSATEPSTDAKKPAGTFFDSGTADDTPGAWRTEQAPGIGAAIDPTINVDESLTLQTEITETSRDYLAKCVQTTADVKAQPTIRQRIEHAMRPRSKPAEPDGLYQLSTHRAMRGESTMPESKRAELREAQNERARRGLMHLRDLLSR
ncbi:hypothetical protein [Burkholderia pseudomultivorans]|uniref:hypothetical protein n=1 Tax=Burkholderia pseudomultivorans TaxID=1207504 RepID=UPI000841F2A1|nr:hypothetical protein [Burkholderia pseudomultivorans]AOI92790.1 hypothetical protein WS57_29510 [Burkholderia pseudomultivorans]